MEQIFDITMEGSFDSKLKREKNQFSRKKKKPKKKCKIPDEKKIRKVLKKRKEEKMKRTSQLILIKLVRK